MKVLILTRYSSNGASSRLRSLQFLPWFQSNNIECCVSPLIDNLQLANKYEFGRYNLSRLLVTYAKRIAGLLRRERFDLVWIEKELFPWVPLLFERFLLQDVCYILDFDDAIFHNYDQHSNFLIRYFYGCKIDKLMKKSRLVIAGNRYLARRAQIACAPWVEVVPTVIDLNRYKVKSFSRSKVPTVPRIVWIGSPSTTHYLSLIADPLATLNNRQPFILRLIGGGPIELPGVNVERFCWSEEKESDLIAECDIGVMPLFDTPWEQGKCAYKLIQYMACGLPTVASPVGANLDVVEEGKTGFLAELGEDWVGKLELLLTDTAIRQKMGHAGRSRVEDKYCTQKVGPRLINLLFKAMATAT